MLRISLLLTAIVTGFAAAWLAVQMRAPSPVTIAAPAPPRPAMKQVLVAAEELQPAQPLTNEKMRWQPWPEEALNPLYITRSERPDAPDVLVGSVVRTRMTAGEPIRESNLTRRAGFLAAILPSGKRAVAVRISAENTAGGFILPNDRVDVLQTDNQDQISRTILQNVPVLAIDQLVDESGKENRGKATVIGKTATLELDPAEVEILTAAQAKGIISLSLRSAADNNEDRLPLSSRTVRIIRAGKSEVIKTQ